MAVESFAAKAVTACGPVAGSDKGGGPTRPQAPTGHALSQLLLTVVAMSAILALGALLIVSYGVRIVLRRVYSVLDNVPGPPRTSIMTGRRPGFPHPT
jgi:hypothetical protein